MRQAERALRPASWADRGALARPLRRRENAMADKTATLKLPDGKSSSSRCCTERPGPTWSTSARSTARSGVFTYDPGFLSTASCNSTITYIDGDAGHPALPRLSDRAAGAALRFPRGLLPAAERRAAQPQAEGRVRRHRHPPHHGARADQPLLSGLPARRASDGGDGRRGRRAVGLLSRRARHQRPAPPRDLGVPADREDADDRRDGLQVLDRPAVHVSEERPVLHARTSCA